MKTNKIILSALVAAGMMSGLAAMPAMAAAGDGTLNFTGSVVDAACTVAPDSKNMTVDFGTIGLVAFQNNSYPFGINNKSIKIELTNCPSTISSAAVAIVGNSVPVFGYDGEGLAVDEGAGSAKDVAIMFAGTDGHVALYVNGPSSAAVPLTEGVNTIIVSAGLKVRDGVSANASAGTISATAQYNIVYP